VGPRDGLDGRKLSSPPGFDPELSSPLSVGIPTELPGPHEIPGVYAKGEKQFALHRVICDAPRAVTLNPSGLTLQIRTALT